MLLRVDDERRAFCAVALHAVVQRWGGFHCDWVHELCGERVRVLGREEERGLEMREDC